MFELRLLDVAAYADVSERLSAARRDPEALAPIVARAEARLRDPTFLKFNLTYDWLVGEWRNALRDAASPPAPDAVDRVAEIAVATSCMPEFQYSLHSAPEPSPNLVALGDYDAGLFGIITGADAWCQDLFSKGFGDARATFGVGNAMIVLDRADLARLRNAVVQATEPASRDPRTARVLDRLRSLVDRALANERHTIAISDATG